MIKTNTCFSLHELDQNFELGIVKIEHFEQEYVNIIERHSGATKTTVCRMVHLQKQHMKTLVVILAKKLKQDSQMITTKLHEKLQTQLAQKFK